MSIPCIATQTCFDVQCPVCGRGFLLLTAPTLSLQRGSMRRAARRALAQQHDHPLSITHADPHGDEVFDLPGWDGELEAARTLRTDLAAEKMQISN